MRERLDVGRQRMLEYCDQRARDYTITYPGRNVVMVGPPGHRMDPGIRLHPTPTIIRGLRVMIPVSEDGDPPFNSSLDNVVVFGDAMRFEIWEVVTQPVLTAVPPYMEIQRILRVQPNAEGGDGGPQVFNVEEGEIRRAYTPNSGVVVPTEEFMVTLNGRAQWERNANNRPIVRGERQDETGEEVGGGIGVLGGRGEGGGVRTILGDERGQRGIVRDRDYFEKVAEMVADTSKALRKFVETSDAIFLQQHVHIVQTDK